MTIPPDLPPALRAALERASEGASRRDAGRRAAKQSETYRAGGGSRAIASEADALAYALARMPATYAANAACLNALIAQRPDFAPQSLLDLGAGPATASWAAATAFASLARFDAIDANAALRDLALALARGSRLGGLAYARAEASAAALPQADLVIASYIIGELAADARAALIDRAWRATQGVLLIVEPGTPDGYARILGARAQAIAQGAFVAAPCPHEAACPLIAPDWCHFVQRLPRLRAHRAIKGERPFEDEKFAYVALSRDPPAQRPARVLTQPFVDKAQIAAKLCTAGGLRRAIAARRDKDAYARFRRLDWGDAIAPDA